MQDMKKILSTLVLALLSLAASAYVDQGNLSTGLRWVLDDEYTLKVSGAGEIPDYGTTDIDGMLIMSGAPWGKTYYNKVKAIEVADGVTGIGKNAFNGMIAVTSVEIAKSVKYIGDQAFMNCTKLTSAEVPAAVKSLGKYAFSGCSALASIVINGELTIGERAFNGCTALKSMTYGGANPPAVLESVFSRVPMSSGTLYVPAHAVSTYKATGVWNSWGTITAITSGKTDDGMTWSFEDGTLTINGVGAMGKYYIDNYDGVTATSAPWGPFYDKITKVVMSNTIFNIGDYAFYNLVNMSSLQFSPYMTKIGERALQYCDNLKSITLPASVGELGMYCFSPSGIRTINCEGHIPPMVEKSTCFNGLSNKPDVTVNVPLGAVPDYEGALGWNTFKNIKCPMEGWSDNIYWSVNEDFSELTLSGNGEMPYYGTTQYWDGVYTTKAIWGHVHDKVRSLVVKAGITYISEGAFANFSQLEKVTLSPTMENVGTLAFSECPNLSEMTVQAAVPPTVMTSTFRDTDTSMGTLYVLPSAVDAYKESGWNVWGDIRPISHGTVGEDLPWNVVNGVLTIMGPGVMPDFNTMTLDGETYVTDAPWGILWNDITEVVIEEGVDNIGSRAFQGMTNLKTVTLPEEEDIAIGDYVFFNTGIEEPVYNSKVFAYMPARMTKCTVPDGIERIAPYAFYSSSITEVRLPASLESVGKYAFADCDYLTTVLCSAVTPPAAESNTFGGSTLDYMGTLIVPDGSEDAYKAATGWSGWGNITSGTKATKIAFEQSSYKVFVGSEMGLKVIFTPLETTNKKLEYSSSDESVATVDEYGMVTGVGVGTAVILAQTTDGSNLMAFCTITVEPLELAITDGVTTMGDLTVGMDYDKITYTRTYTGKWEALYVPLSLDADALSDRFEIARVIAVNDVDENGDMKPDYKALQAKVMTVGQTIPQTPYLIRAKVPGEQEIVLENASVSAAGADEAVTFSTLSTTYTIRGSYDATAMSGCYIPLDGEMKAADAISAFRWGMTMTNRATDEPIAATTPLHIMTTEEMITGVDEIGAQQTADGIYNLQGQRLQKMQKGLNIVGGRKVMQK